MTNKYFLDTIRPVWLAITTSANEKLLHKIAKESATLPSYRGIMKFTTY
jgi:hypothetical protein